MITAMNVRSRSVRPSAKVSREDEVELGLEVKVENDTESIKSFGVKPSGKRSITKPNLKSKGRLITTGPGHVFSKFVSRVTIRPRKQLTIPIGNTFTGCVPKGFSIGLSPGNSVGEIIDMEVIAFSIDKSTPNKLEYKLHVVNNGNKTVSAEVWAI